MFFSSWLRKLNGKPRTNLRTTSRFRPRVEVLEGRDVPSTLTVTNINDGGLGSLRDEIAQAQSNDTIVFDKSLFFSQVQAGHNKHTIQTIRTPQTMILASAVGELVINKNLTILGPGGDLLTIESQTWVDGAFNSHWGSRIFEVDGAGTTVALSGLTLTGGGGTRLGGGATSYLYSNEGYGGAILNFGELTVSGCTLGGNNRIGITSLTGNDAQFGGAIANFGTMKVTNCDISNNRANGVADALGGGIYNAGTMTVSGGDVSYNSSFQGGGGIYNTGTMTVSVCTLSYDSAYQGGGIYNAGTMTVSGCTLSGDHAAPYGGAGGGIYNASTAAALTVLNSIFSSNNPDNINGPYTDGGGNTFG
jgi:predicted outer membrane repeat protein